MKALPFALAFAGSIAGCSSVGGPLDAVQETVANVVLPPEQAEQLGDRMAQQIEAQSAVHSSGALQQRVQRIGQRLLAQATDVPPSYDFTFKVLADERTVNAMALPGGHIYVTAGMMKMANTDAELAAVVGHEIAHVTERHVAERLAGQYGLQVLSAAALGNDPGAITQLASSVLQQGALLRYSRDQELQADRVGAQYMRQAGYDVQGAVDIFRKMARQEGAGGPPAFLSSHPTTERRIEQLQQIIARGG